MNSKSTQFLHDDPEYIASKYVSALKEVRFWFMWVFVAGGAIASFYMAASPQKMSYHWGWFGDAFFFVAMWIMPPLMSGFIGYNIGNLMVLNAVIKGQMLIRQTKTDAEILFSLENIRQLLEMKRP